jgi:FkbM family methyltransferase
MLNPVKMLRTPEYLFHPRQVIRRFARIGRQPQERESLLLPWHARVDVRMSEKVAQSIYYYGVFDPIVPEAIWRLLDCGETGVDIGANIGQNTSAMAARSGPTGRVIAFEPHPVTFAELRGNQAHWSNRSFAPVQLENTALGATEGEAMLATEGCLSDAALGGPGIGVKVPIRRLDDYAGPALRVGVCKMDVEGHELPVLAGASQTLQRRAVRDLIFEDFRPQPSPVTRALQEYGFKVYRLAAGWLKPRILPLDAPLEPNEEFSHNFLATLEPERARQRFEPAGWRCLMHW